MPISLADVVLVAAIVTNGLLAGLYFAFACSVTGALGRLDDRSYVGGFRAINTEILNPAFLSTFFLSPLLAAVAAWLGFGDGGWWLVAGAALAVATFAITVARNVPLNQRLDGALLAHESDVHTAREQFERPWARWNTVRTLTGIGAVGFLALGAMA